MSTTAAIGLARVPPRGCSAPMAPIWARRSGAALSKVQCSASADTATLVCVRGRPAGHLPRRAGRPGNGNSIADSHPRPPNRARWRSGAPCTGAGSRERYGSEFGRQVAVDLEPDADFDEGRGCPGHLFPPRTHGAALAVMATKLPFCQRPRNATRSGRDACRVAGQACGSFNATPHSGRAPTGRHR